MANGIVRGLGRLTAPRAAAAQTRNAVTVASLRAAGLDSVDVTASTALKLSAVDRCVEVLSSDIAKLPMYVFDTRTRQRRDDHPLNDLLGLRANSVQTAFVARKVAEAGRNCGGNGYLLIERDPRTLAPVRLVGVPWTLVQPMMTAEGEPFYDVEHPFTGKLLRVGRMDMIHVMAYSDNGWKGVSVLERASEVIASAKAAQSWNGSYYINGGQPSGVLEVDSDISGTMEVAQADGTTATVNMKDYVRQEWEARQGGPGNAGRIAVLDNGMKYHAISISQRDAQFVENAELSVRDIARFFGVPLYKLQEGKQSYSSNEQNAIEYITGTLHPIVTQYEQEATEKLLNRSERADGLEIRINMMAELRGDSSSRGSWYNSMWQIGAYSVNDIRALEDMPDVEGGGEHTASLNYVPLSVWRELSIKRNSGNGGNGA